MQKFQMNLLLFFLFFFLGHTYKCGIQIKDCSVEKRCYGYSKWIVEHNIQENLTQEGP